MARVFRAKKTLGTAKATGFIAAVIAIIVLTNICIGKLSVTQEEKQLEVMQDAIIKAAVQCYALESQFPPSIQYRADNYGLTFDENKYIYHYRTIGSNMVPEIKVFLNNSGGGGR